MNLSVLAAQEEVDPVSGFQLNVLTFIFYYALEIDVFFMRTSDTLLKRYESTLLHDFGNAEVHMTGSVAEGLFLPVDFNNGNFISMADFDVMFLPKKVKIRDKCHYDYGPASPVSSEYTFVLEANEEDRQQRESCRYTCTILKKNASLDEPYLTVETWPSTHEGYLMLRRCRPVPKMATGSLYKTYISSVQCVKAHAEELNMFQKDTETEVTCWPDSGSSFGQMCGMLNSDYYDLGLDESMYQPRKMTHNPVFEFQEQGPSAFSVMQENPYSSSADIQHDNVLGLPYPGWPDSAREWLVRNGRSSGWPSQAMRSEILAKGCHFVAVGHHNSEVKDYEFRLSFSMAELVLIRSFSRTQRAIVLILKIFLKTMLPSPSALSSYHIKTTMLWMSETLHPRDWKMEKLGKLLLDVLDKWISFLKDRNLPNYFVRRNNMLSHQEDVAVSEAVKQLEKIRRDPVSALDSLERYMRMSFTSYKDLKKVLIQPFLDGKQRNMLKDLEKVIQVIQDFGELHIKNKHLEAARLYFEDGIKLYVEQKVGHLGFEILELVSLAADTCHKLCNTVDGIRHHEMLVDLLSRDDISEKAPENRLRLSQALGVLAKLYHVHSKRVHNAQLKQQYLSKAGDAFKMSLSKSPDHIFSLLYYSNYLMERTQYEQAIPLLRRAVQNIPEDDFELHLKSCDAEIFDAHVHEIIEQYLQEIEIPVSTATYYLLHECFVQVGLASDAAKTLEEFENSSSCKGGLYSSIVFLGHSYLKTSNPEKGQELIDETKGSKSVFHTDKLEEKLRWVEHIIQKMAERDWENSKLAAILKP